MRYLVQLLFSVCMANSLYAADIGSGDFAAGYYLELSGKGPIYALEIPQEVYRTVTRADLGDIRVFNSAGEVVPHGLKKAETAPESGRIKEAVPYFPLYEGGGGDVQAGMMMRVGRSNDGTILSIVPPPASDNVQRSLSGYLLDLTNLKRVPMTLEFQWLGDAQPGAVNIELRQSDDLVSWSRQVRKATLVDLRYGGQRVERKTVRLAYPPKKYLKLTWQKKTGDFTLTSVVSSSGIVPSRMKRQWLSLNAREATTEDGLLLVDFTSSYHLPADSAQIVFSQSNSMAKVAISSRDNEESKWQLRCEQLFYNLDLEGAVVHNEPCTFSPKNHRLWRMAIKEDGAGLDKSASSIGLQLGWTPSQLYFVGRGSPPYLLAFGSGKLQQDTTNSNNTMVLQAIESATADQSIVRAGIGKRIELGGKEALQPPPIKPPWKKWLLWAVLGLGVAVLAFMARSLVQEMKVSGQQSGDGQS